MTLVSDSCVDAHTERIPRLPPTMSQRSAAVPKLAYIADVPVSATSSGMLLVYRLFEGYPADRLVVFESMPSPADVRLRGVRYEAFGWARRLQNTRFHRAYVSLAITTSGFDIWWVSRLLRDKGFEAVITVTHGPSWVVADGVASRLGIPLIMLSHDYWFPTCPAIGYPPERLHAMFGAAYRRASERFCVSSEMALHYETMYRAPSLVQYPIRAERAACFPNAVVARPFTVAYAGTVAHDGYHTALRRMAEALCRIGGTLLVYSNLSKETGVRIATNLSNVIFKQFVPSTEIVARLQTEADALFIPMPSEVGTNARLCFPSKLADYTSAALPIIVLGARDSSVYRWARDRPSAVMAVAEDELPMLDEAIHRLSKDAVLRRRMGKAAFEIGDREFGARKIRDEMIARIACATSSTC